MNLFCFYRDNGIEYHTAKGGKVNGSSAHRVSALFMVLLLVARHVQKPGAALGATASPFTIILVIFFLFIYSFNSARFSDMECARHRCFWTFQPPKKKHLDMTG